MAKASTRSRSSRKASKSAKKSAKQSARKPAPRASRRPPPASRLPLPPIALLFPDLESELATTRRMLERVPNGSNDWRPHAKSRTLGELATHVAQLPGFGILMSTRDEFDGLAGRREEPALATSAERVAMFDQLS